MSSRRPVFVAALAVFCSAACGSPAPETVGSSSAAVTTVCGASDTSGIQGVDVSVYQGAFDWTSAKAGGVVWGYARIGDGLGGDSEFASNWSNMKAAGVLRGAYQFFEPGEDEVAQANLMISAVGTLGLGDMPCMIDVEVTGGQTGATIASKVGHWIQLVQAGTGKAPIIYTGPYFWEDNVGSTAFSSTPLWVADYGPSCPLIPNGWSNWTMWQYSDGGGSLDHDVFNGSMAQLQALAGSGAPEYPILVHRGAVDINGDGTSDICGRSAAGIICEISNGAGDAGLSTTELQTANCSDASNWNKPEYYWTIQFADINGDGKGDLCARDSQGIVCELSTGGDFTGGEVRGPDWSDASGWNQPQYYTTIQFGDVDGDGKADVCGRASTGMLCALSTGSSFEAAFDGPGWSDQGSWDQPQYYGTIQLTDVNGDGLDDICARAAAGMYCELSNGSGFPTEIQGPAWSDGSGWAAPQYMSTIRYADVNGDGMADICGRAAVGVACELSNGTGFPTEVAGPAWSDASGWNQSQYYLTIQTADVNGDGMQDLCARDSEGVVCEVSNGTGFPTEITGPGWSSASGWDSPEYDSTVGFADIDGDGKDDVCARGWAGMFCALSNGGGFATANAGATWSDPSGWGSEAYYSTIRYTGVKTRISVPHKPPGNNNPDGGAPNTGPSNNHNNDNNGNGASSGGCAMASSAAPAGGGSWLFGLGLGLVLSRRRVRRL